MAIGPETVFDDGEDPTLTTARLEHLSAMLEFLDIEGLSVLRLGAGNGDDIQFWVERGCNVTVSDPRPENVAVLRARFPTIDVRELDLDGSPLPGGDGGFDIVHAYGALARLQDIERGVGSIAEACRRLAIIEVCVDRDQGGEHLPALGPGPTGDGDCRWSRSRVYDVLRAHFAHVYQPATQPAHEQFPLDWTAPEAAERGPSRTIFVASRQVLEKSGLYPRLLEKQVVARPAASTDGLVKLMVHLGIRNVVDVGANSGQFAQALRTQGYEGYIVSFEPIRPVAEDLHRAAARDAFWDAHGVALGADRGAATLNISENMVGSSFLDIEERMTLAEPSTRYRDSAVVEIETIDHLWPSLRLRFCAGAAMLKLDVQGYEAHVIAGAQASLQEFDLILMNCSLVPLYRSETLLTDMLPKMANHGLHPVWIRQGRNDEKTGQVYQCELAFARTLDVRTVSEPAEVETAPVSTPSSGADGQWYTPFFHAFHAFLRNPDHVAVEGTEDWALLGSLAKNLPMSHAQLFQDLMVLHVLDEPKSGFFVEVGACDGVTLSNTYLLEKRFGWQGIVAEPGRCWHAALSRARNCYVSTKCVTAQSDLKVVFNETEEAAYSTIDRYSSVDSHSTLRENGRLYEVETISINDLLQEGNAPQQIDYMSVDTEGSELDILKAIDFNRYNIKIFTVEHNYTQARELIFNYLTNNGYIRKYESLSLWDDWYFRCK